MPEMEQDQDQNKTKAPSKGQIATEKRNACESGLHQTSEIEELILACFSYRAPLTQKQAAETCAEQLLQGQRAPRPQCGLWWTRRTRRIHRKARVISIKRRSLL